MSPPSLAALQKAADLVHRVMPATPQFHWPQLSERMGAEVWVKHENHTPIGSFKLRGGLVYFDELVRREPRIPGVIAATRGNHGQSIAFAARRHGLKATIVVPHGNSREKNAAMRAWGARLIEHGADFQEALEYAGNMAGQLGLHFVPSFHEALVRGVASYSLELFRAVGDLRTLYVPIGLGSGICGAVAARDALGLSTEIVGVVSAAAPAYAESYAAGKAVARAVGPSIADGVACRVPNDEALGIILAGVERVVAVSEAEIAAALRDLFTGTHNVAEGAGAAALAAAAQERDRIQGRRIGVVQTGSNIDRDVFVRALA